MGSIGVQSVLETSKCLRSYTLDDGLLVTLPRPILYRLIRTSGVVWFGVRFFAGSVRAFGYSPGEVIFGFSPGEVIFVSLAVLLITWMDLRAKREILLLGNLGISPLLISGVVLSSAFALELLFATILPQVVGRTAGG